MLKFWHLKLKSVVLRNVSYWLHVFWKLNPDSFLMVLSVDFPALTQIVGQSWSVMGRIRSIGKSSCFGLFCCFFPLYFPECGSALALPMLSEDYTPQSTYDKTSLMFSDVGYSGILDMRLMDMSVAADWVSIYRLKPHSEAMDLFFWSLLVRCVNWN